ncbi:helix-turn-helix domain-containing protein [Palleronia abyssalis]|uniref:HTH-type transcriptional regulator ImmR n=1 Tax=Palleronia abyssalis TaxID=1501240 RepID=A0A2R8BXK3_9RHOB|nr:helix-turn-helix domain-containing protein [Palleronia abyssalis]SPJ24870.1 HTH-type transcriptional regulator ImmR [Palleronia abyssalis]
MTEDATQDWYSDETSTFGDRLADARQAVGLSQRDLAQQLGVKLNTLIAWENDVSEPRANRLSMLSGLLNVSLMWLLSGKGEGLAPPVESDMPADVTSTLAEMRKIQAEMVRLGERMGHLEKRLRTAWK